MPSDSGPSIPGWFIALFVIFALFGIATMVWRISVARKFARDAGLDPNAAAAITALSDDGLSATYLASTLRSRPSSQHSMFPVQPAIQPSEPVSYPAAQAKPVEQRLQELQALKDKGLVSEAEYEAQRQKIVGSI